MSVSMLSMISLPLKLALVTSDLKESVSLASMHVALLEWILTPSLVSPPFLNALSRCTLDPLCVEIEVKCVYEILLSLLLYVCLSFSDVSEPEWL